MEKTLVIIKHDAVSRGLMGRIISRFEIVGLKMVAFEFIQSTQDMGHGHYPTTNEWFQKVGERTLNDYVAKGINPKEELGTDDPLEIGKLVKQWNVEYLTHGPVLAIVFEGPDAVTLVRKLVGNTIPSKADPGTIRGDFGMDSIEMANKQKRPLYNLIHASGEITEAEAEISLWFGNQEVYDYKLHSNSMTGVYGKLGS
jgi:nucleoside-diphosphate kinase